MGNRSCVIGNRSSVIGNRSCVIRNRESVKSFSMCVNGPIVLVLLKSDPALTTLTHLEGASRIKGKSMYCFSP